MNLLGAAVLISLFLMYKDLLETLTKDNKIDKSEVSTLVALGYLCSFTLILVSVLFSK